MENNAVVITAEQLQDILTVLQQQQYTVIGPTIEDHAIVYDEISHIRDLPQGWTDEQKPGSYRLHKRDDGAFFGYNVGPHSWKKFVFPPRARLWQAQKTSEQKWEITPEKIQSKKLAFLAMRSCELHAMAIQDKVFLHGKYVDAIYQAQRQDVLCIAVNCGQAGGTCFCHSMQTGPGCKSGYDLVLTEVLGDAHYFVVEPGTPKGSELLQQISCSPASAKHHDQVREIIAQTTQQMGRTLDAQKAPEILQKSYNSKHWEKVAERCLSCANCTMVCPTCFCSDVEDTTDVSGNHAERWRSWDSCFNADFTYIHGGNVRKSTASRYRQWISHKLSTWVDQFDVSGCVGCGRCITWCPVGIDITEEIKSLQQEESQ